MPPPASPHHRRPRPRRVRHLLLLEGDQRGELPRAEVRPAWPSARTTSTPATALDTLPASSVWRQSSVPVVARASYREVEDTDVIVLWGSNARETHPIFFHHVLKAVHRRRPAVRRRPAPHRRPREWADALARPRRRHRHRAGEHDRARDHPRRPGRHERSSSAPPPASTSTRRRSSRGRSSGARWRPASRPRRSASWPTPTPRPTGRSCAGRSASPSTTTPSTTCWRSSTWRCSRGHVGRYGSGLNPLRGPEQRAGRRRHGRDPQPAARASRTSSTTTRGPRSTRAWGCTDPAALRHAPDRRCSRRWSDGELRGAVRDRREPGAERGRRRPRPPAARRPRPPRRAGHLPDQDRRAGRRRAAGRRRRGARPRARSPTASAGCSGCARRSSRRATPATTSGSSLELAAPARPRLARTPAPRSVWDEVRVAVADAPGHDATPGSRSSAASSGRATTRTRSSRRYLHGRLWADDPAERGQLGAVLASSRTSCRSTS